MKGEPVRAAIERLVDILENQRELQRALLDTSARKEAAVRDNQVAALESVVKEEQNLLFRVQDLERQRRTCMQEIGAPGGGMQDVLERADADHHTKLEALREELTQLYEEQQRRNDRNRQLIESKLEYINFMVDAVSFSHNPTQTYGATGRDSAEQQRRKINLYDKQV